MKNSCLVCSKLKVLKKNNKCVACNKDAGLKECPQCHEILPIELLFYKNHCWCKTCDAKYGASNAYKKSKSSWIEANPNYSKEYYKANKDWLLPLKRKKEQNKKYKNIQRYNITMEQYDQMLQEQNGGCKICKNVPVKRKLAIDHDHKTNKVRGLLCNNCNTGIGMFKDNTELLSSAINYLTR